MFKKSGAVLLLSVASASAGEFTFSPPSDDRWHYPFNFTPGSRATGSCFGAVGEPGFNNRDGIVILAWDTSSLIPAGMGPDAYDIISVRVTVTNQANANINPDWPIDLTVDEWFTYDLNGDGQINADGIERGQPGDTDGESSDIDPGRPIELFGAGFGPTHSYAAWTEASMFVGSDSVTVVARDPFPFVFQDSTLTLLHTEDNVAGLFNESAGVFEFTPMPWALGQPIGYTPGAQNVPFDIEFDIDLTQSGGAVRAYFQQQLDSGRAFVVITSLRETVEQGSSSGIPSFYMKEGVALDPGAKAASLSITLAEGDAPAVSQWVMPLCLSAVLLAGTALIVRQRVTTT